MQEYDLIVIGGGAAGYFGAIACAEALPGAQVLILEATSRVLTKVKVSGGGRCNVTHHQFETKNLVQNYPRGSKELLGAFHKFQPKDTVDWFLAHGVELKVEEDGRMFPTTNDSQTIINCFEQTAQSLGVKLRKNSLVQKIYQRTEGGFNVHLKSGDILVAHHILLATGSSPFGVKLAGELGHELIDPVPSLFTFEIADPLLTDLAGISFFKIKLELSVENKVFTQVGPCLITHWGLSGPAVLKLSAFAARELFKSNYKASLVINWENTMTLDQAVQAIEKVKAAFPKRKVINEYPFNFSKRFWESILLQVCVDKDINYSDLSKKRMLDIAKKVTASKLEIQKKGVFKEEFVTAGGVFRDEIDFRTMESKIIKDLYFAGEVIDIDGITGGFNFQNAWTGSWLAGNNIAKKISKK